MMGSDMVRSVAVWIQVDLTQMSIASQLATYLKSDGMSICEKR